MDKGGLGAMVERLTLKEGAGVFFWHFLASGVVIGLVMLIITALGPNHAGFVYGALPLGFVYIIVARSLRNTSQDAHIKELSSFSRFTLIGGVVFIAYIGVYWATLSATRQPVFAAVLMSVVVALSTWVILRATNGSDA
jgi:sulfite exporter TauE/SafE